MLDENRFLIEIPENVNLQSDIIFEKRTCVRFIRDPKTNLCLGCRGEQSKHELKEDDTQQTAPQTKWDYTNCTVKRPTDAYGKLMFPGSHFKSAKYIRVEIETDVTDMIQLLYHPKGWNLQPPKLIISVTGGAQKFTLPAATRKAFKRGLAKAAASTGSWIITGGTEYGVMRLVGEAVAEEPSKYGRDIVVLGIATWGKIALRDRMVLGPKRISVDSSSIHPIEDPFANLNLNHIVMYSKERHQTSDDSVFLCSNHNHFILVDDGSESEFGKEIEFRARLENELRKGRSLNYYQKLTREKFVRMRSGTHSTVSNISFSGPSSNIDGIPMILIVVQGGQGTLKTVYESLLQNVPILILADSKGCADLISNACLTESKDKFSQLIEESQIIERFRKNPILYEENMNLSLKWLRYIVDQKHKNLINVFKLENEEENQDIEISILKAFINSNPKKYFENFKFALKWDRFDIANMFIFTGEEEFKFIELAYLLELALVENKPKFVEYILENGLNLKSFVTINRLKFLYNSQKMRAVAKKSPFFRLLRKQQNNKGDGIARFSDLRNFLRNYLFDDFEPEFLRFHRAVVIDEAQNEDEDQNENESDDENIDLTVEEIEKKREGKKINFPEKNLFVWALLMNRIEIAKIFWRIGEHQICTALFGYYLLKSMSRKLNDMKIELMEKANEFEEMAFNVLNSIDIVTLDVINYVVLLRRNPYYNRTCLELAVEAGSLKFISLPAVQNLLSEIWIGNIEIERGFTGRLKYFLSCLSYGFLAPYLIKNKPSLSAMLELVDEIGQEKIAKTLKYSGGSRKNKFDSTDDKTNSKQTTSEFNYIERYKHFISSPKICFLYETIFFHVFLILFSYMLLCEFQFEPPKKDIDISPNLTYNNSNDYHKVDNTRNFPQFIEFLLLFWIFTYIIDELRQMIFTKSQRNISVRFWSYFSSLWNLMDTFGSLFFIVGFILRSVAWFEDNEVIFVTARIAYAIDLSIWYLRLLHVSMVLKALGPKLIMIQKMLYDLSFFILIVLIFVILFGVTTQATMYPGNKLNLELFKNIINKAYWPIYGDIRLLDEINFDDKNCTLENPSCPNAMGAYYSLFLLIFYMVIANVLLLNLLIAMFSFRFNNVQENTDLIWKFQMYELIDEYKDSYAFPPPISFISYLIFAINYFITKKSSHLSDFYLDPKSRSRTLEYALSLERQFAEEYFINKKMDEREMIESRLKTANEKLEILERRLNEIIKNKNV